jgi:DNA-binding response OmpR family regulator
MLTARTNLINGVWGLELGAHDYRGKFSSCANCSPVFPASLRRADPG